MTSKRKIGLAAYYNLLSKPRGYGLAAHHYPVVAGLEDDRIENFLVLCPPGAGKSNLLCSVYPTWLLGHEPETTILSVSAGEKLPQGFMAACMQIIQYEPNFKRIFPEVKPAPQFGWSLQRGLFVTGHQPSDPDATYVSVGLTSKALTGLHARLHIYDDIHDRENSNSVDARAGVRRAYYDTLLGRADPRGCRRIAAGRWWAEDDLYQEWISSGDWVVLQLPASRPGQARLWYDVFVPRGLENVFTETLEPEPVQDPGSLYDRYRAYYGAVDQQRRGFYWPGSPSKRREYEVVKRRSPRIAAINYDGNMSGGADSIFLDTDFVPFIPPEGLDYGLVSPNTAAWIEMTKGEVESAWDTALGQVFSASMTVALTGLLIPCQSWHRDEDPAVVGDCDFHFDVWLLDAVVKSVDFRDLALLLRTQFAKWHPRRVTVEEKSSGVSLLQTFRGSHIPIKGQSVQQGKVERAINPVIDAGMPVLGGAASVQGWGRMGRIRYPLGAKWIDHRPDSPDEKETGFLRRVLSYAGGARASDEFDTLVHLVTRAIVKSRRHGRIGVAPPQDLLPFTAASADPRKQVLDDLSTLPEWAETNAGYFDGLCGAPCHYYGVTENKEWCTMHGRQTTAIGGCPSWQRREKAA